MRQSQDHFSEKDFEQWCCEDARKGGCICWKNVPHGLKGIPDRSFVTEDGRFFMVEFKKNKSSFVRYEQKVWKEKYPNIVFFCSSEADWKKIKQRFGIE